jgi:hypothetical protein
MRVAVVAAVVAKPAPAPSSDQVSDGPGIEVGMLQTLGPFTGTYATSEEPAIQAMVANGTSRKPSRAEPFRPQDAPVKDDYKLN